MLPLDDVIHEHYTHTHTASPSQHMPEGDFCTFRRSIGYCRRGRWGSCIS